MSPKLKPWPGPQGHKPFNPKWVVCPVCGAQAVSKPVEKVDIVDPRKHYVLPGEEDDWDGKWVHIVHQCNAELGVYLGVRMARVDEDREDAPIPAPSLIQREELDAFLTRIGYVGPPPMLHLVWRSS